MNLFKIQPSKDVREVGIFPQTAINSDYIHPFYHVKYEELHSSEVIGKLNFNSGAIATDMIFSSAMTFGFIISSRFYEIIKLLKLPPFKVYPIVVNKDHQEHQYYWLHYYLNIRPYLNLDETTLTIFNSFNLEVIRKEVKLSEFGNIFDYQKSLPKNQGLRLNKLVFDQIPNFDLFDINILFHLVPVISENLKEIIEESDLTGIQLDKFDV